MFYPSTQLNQQSSSFWLGVCVCEQFMLNHLHTVLYVLYGQCAVNNNKIIEKEKKIKFITIY